MELTRRKTAVITGSTRGIGKAIAFKLAQNEYNVVLNYAANDVQAQETLQLCQQITPHVLLVKADVTGKQEVEALMQACIQTFHSLDVLVNNAARVLDRPLLDMSEEEWDRVVQTTMKGSFLCSQVAASYMLEQKPFLFRELGLRMTSPTQSSSCFPMKRNSSMGKKSSWMVDSLCGSRKDFSASFVLMRLFTVYWLLTTSTEGRSPGSYCALAVRDGKGAITHVDQERSDPTYGSRSYWHRTVSFPTFSSDLPAQADVVVIGGGLLGAATCYWAARTGCSVVLLERASLAAGATGRNGGFISIGPDEAYVQAIARLGHETARTILDVTLESRTLLRRLLGEEDIACDYREPGHLHLALEEDEKEMCKRYNNSYL